MDPISGSSSHGGLQLPGPDLDRYPPEPRTSFGEVLKGITGFASSALSAGLGGAVDIAPGYASLIQAQIYHQEQMQLVSLYSNIEKSKHETNMSAIRNVRVG